MAERKNNVNKTQQTKTSTDLDEYTIRLSLQNTFKLRNQQVHSLAKTSSSSGKESCDYHPSLFS